MNCNGCVAPTWCEKYLRCALEETRDLYDKKEVPDGWPMSVQPNAVTPRRGRHVTDTNDASPDAYRAAHSAALKALPVLLGKGMVGEAVRLQRRAKEYLAHAGR